VKNTAILIVTWMILILASGCASNRSILSDFDPAQDFSAYQTFSWISDQPMSVSGDYGPSPLDASRIQNAILKAFKGKGYRFVNNPAQANFVVAFTVGARDKTELRSHSTFYGPHWTWGHDYFGVYGRDPTRNQVFVKKYSEGSLSIDVFDVSRKSPVWHGSGSKRLKRKVTDGDSEAAIPLAVTAILESFPSR